MIIKNLHFYLWLDFFKQKSNDKILESIYEANYIYIFDNIYKINCIFLRFPTIYFAQKGAKQNPKRYEGGREVDDFIKYIAKEATDPLNGWDRNGKKTKKSEL